jgi:hypothetical protein
MTDSQVTVTTSPTALFTGPGKFRLWINTGTVRLGGATVAYATGVAPSGAFLDFELAAADTLYAITSAGTADIRVLSWY